MGMVIATVAKVHNYAAVRTAAQAKRGGLAVIFLVLD